MKVFEWLGGLDAQRGRPQRRKENIVKSRAVRLHAAMDLRLDEFELPPIKDDEMLVRVVSDTICMSTYKMAKLGVNHKRVHADVAEHPAITGHEFAGDIVEVGTKYKDKYKPGQKFTIQPAINYKGSMDSPGTPMSSAAVTQPTASFLTRSSIPTVSWSTTARLTFKPLWQSR